MREPVKKILIFFVHLLLLCLSLIEVLGWWKQIGNSGRERDAGIPPRSEATNTNISSCLFLAQWEVSFWVISYCKTMVHVARLWYLSNTRTEVVSQDSCPFWRQTTVHLTPFPLEGEDMQAFYIFSLNCYL